MQFEYSKHWCRKRKYRKDITEDMFEYAIMNSLMMSDKRWPDVLNAIAIIPTTGRSIKVVYRKMERNKYWIITAYWLD